MDENFLPRLQKKLHDSFGIDHSVIQVEREDEKSCFSDKHECK